MFPTIHIGPLSIQAPGLILILGFWLALTVSERYSHHFQINSESIYRLSLISLAAGLMGARLSYAILNLSAFESDPMAFFALTLQMLDLSGGILGAVLAGLIYSSSKKLSSAKLLDALTPGLAILTIALSFANLASGDAFGAPTDLPWGIYLWGKTRHPSQIYELAANIIIAFMIWKELKQINIPASSGPIYGLTFTVFIIFQSAIRLFLESFRGDSPMIGGSIRLVQVIAWGTLGFGMYLHRRFLRPIRLSGE